MKSTNLTKIFFLMILIFSSCSEAEDPLTLVGRWEATDVRYYTSNVLEDKDRFDPGEMFLNILENKSLNLEEDNGDIFCRGSYNSVQMNSKPQKISLCGDEMLLTIKSNNTITITLEVDDEREEIDFKRI